MKQEDHKVKVNMHYRVDSVSKEKIKTNKKMAISKNLDRERADLKAHISSISNLQPKVSLDINFS